MGRHFVGGTDGLYDNHTHNLWNYPITFGCFVKSEDYTSVDQVVMWIGSRTVHNQGWYLQTMSTGVASIFTHYYGGLSSHRVSGTASLVNGQWHHLCVVAGAYDDRRIFTNGGDKQTDTGEAGNTNLQDNRIAIGWAGDTTPGYADDLKISHAFVYDVALEDAEIAVLGKGADPRSVRPASLVAYYPIIGTDPEIDLSGEGSHLTVQDTPVVCESRPIFSITKPWAAASAASAFRASPYYYTHMLAGAV